MKMVTNPTVSFFRTPDTSPRVLLPIESNGKKELDFSFDLALLPTSLGSLLGNDRMVEPTSVRDHRTPVFTKQPKHRQLVHIVFSYETVGRKDQLVSIRSLADLGRKKTIHTF